jgi:hypothetical protein
MLNSFEKRLVSTYPGAHGHHSNDWFSRCAGDQSSEASRGNVAARTNDLPEAYQEIARGIGGRLGGEIEKLEMERLKGVCFTYECAATPGSYN